MGICLITAFLHVFFLSICVVGVEACDSATPQDTSIASYYRVVHTPSDDKLSSGTSKISCSLCLFQVTQCMPTSGHALLTSCPPTGPYDAPQSTETFSLVTN